MTSLPVSPPSDPLTIAVASYARAGWVVESQTPSMAVMNKPHKWVWHLMGSVVSCGLWLFVWPFFALVPKRRLVLTVVDGVVTSEFSRR